MRLFYKKNKKEPSEKDIAKQQAELRRKYPQMYEDVQSDVNYLAGLPPELRKDVLKKTGGKRLKRRYRR